MDSPRNYDVSPDGQSFVLLEPLQGGESREIRVVHNWFEELKSKVPTDTD